MKALNQSSLTPLISPLISVLFVSLIGLGTWGGNAYAATCTSIATGNWNAQTTWGAAGTGCAGATGGIPGTLDIVNIANLGANHVVTVTANAAAASVAFTGGTRGSQLVLGAGITLNVTGAVTINAATSATAGRNKVLNVGSGTLNAASISIAAGTATTPDQVTVSTGTITTTGNITFTGTAANAQFISTGASMVNVGGNFASGGTLTTGGTGTINFNGGVAQTIGAYATYNNITINNTAGGVALAGNATIGGTLSVNTGTLTVGAFTLAVTGVTTVNSAISITSATGTKTFTGNVIINSGGTLSETVAVLITYGGNLTINSGGTLTEFGAATMTCAGSLLNDGTYTASTGVHTFSGAAKTFSGANAIVIPSVAVTGTYANSGTLTVGTALSGAGSLTNTAMLNIGGTSSITTLTNQGTATITGAGAISTALANFTNTGTLNLNGTGTITGITNTGTINLATSGTITALANNAAGTLNISTTPTVPTITTLTATVAGNTVNYSGAGNQTVKATTYSNLGLSGSGAKAMGVTTINGNFTMSGAATTAPTGALTVGGNFTIGVGTTFTAGALAHSVGGNWSNSGTFTAGTSTVTFNGAAQQTLTGATTFNNLTVNNAAGITINNDVTVGTLLTLTSGVVTTGANILGSSANCPASITRTGGFVDGNLRLTFPTGTTTCTYHVGSGGNYTPIGVTMVASAGGTLTGSTTGNEHPQISSSGIDSTLDVNRYWTLWASGDTVVATSYGATFNFVAGDVDALATTGNFVVGKYASSAWTLPTPVTATATSTGASNVAGPINSITDFVAGEAVFVCSVPVGSPVGTTCVCDNFNRASLNPSTIYSGNWNVSTSSGTFGLPLIVANKLRLTDNTGNVATAATAPGTYPAKGNWITVEFKHYAYSGTGADGIAFTLSDALITAAPGAFGGSLGYAQKTGINGFAGGWVGIGIDEFGNFSANTEGRTGVATPPPTAPGLTLDSVAVRGSGSGQTGYPYLGGTATLTPPIDAPTPATAGLGHAYRLTVDARGYTWDGATGTKSTLISVDRDTTGTGTSYTPLVPAFDAYVANPAQANVPTDWQLSFTGSSGGSTNIHEITGLKICAQTFVPPAGYRIQVDNLTPTTCPTDPQPTVTINPLNANGQVITTYTNTVDLAATLASGGGGGASSATWIPYPSNLGTWDGVNKRYTFVAGDNGVAKFYLSDLVQQNVYITVSEYLGTLNSSLGTPVYFSSGAASFVVSTPDTLGTVVVAGRAHLMSITRNKATCGGGTDTTYTGAKPLDGWYDPAVGDHPTGAAAPQICLPNAGACLPSYGTCQTLSIAAPALSSSSNNLNLTFASGVANFCLVTSDVGKYALGLRDDSVATGTPAVTGASAILTARPFAVVVSDVKQGATNNPANNTSGGSVFAKAGTDFQATVGGYLWNSAGDTGSNGLPGAAVNWSAIAAAGIAPSYADTVTLAAGAPFTPAAGTLSNAGVTPVTVAVASGSTTATTLSYNEVGSFTLTATPATSYLNSGINLSNRVAIFSNPLSTSQNGLVGRFIPDHFTLSGTLTNRGAAGCAPASSFTYLDEGLDLTFTLTAERAGGGATTNYAGAWAKFVPTVFANYAVGARSGTTNLTSISGAVIGAPAWASGVLNNVTVRTTVARAALPDGPWTSTQFGIAPIDSDVTQLLASALNLDVDNNAVNDHQAVGATTELRFGRLRMLNAYGSELLDIRLPVRVEYSTGPNSWSPNSLDNCTILPSSSIALGNYLPPPAGTAVSATNMGVAPTDHRPGSNTTLVGGSGTIVLAKPSPVASGSFDVVLNLGTGIVSPNSCVTTGTFGGGTAASLGYLLGNWCGSNHDRAPSARVKLGSPKAPYIYLRERY